MAVLVRIMLLEDLAWRVGVPAERGADQRTEFIGQPTRVVLVLAVRRGRIVAPDEAAQVRPNPAVCRGVPCEQSDRASDPGDEEA